MKIILSGIQTDKGEQVDAWIEPTRSTAESPFYDSFLVGIKGSRSTADLLGKPQPEEVEWLERPNDAELMKKIAIGFGYQAARTIMAETKHYAETPFFAVVSHPQLGRLYAATTDESGAMLLETRPEQTSLAQSVKFENREELQAFLTSGFVAASPSWMPTRENLLDAMRLGLESSTAIFDAFAEYQPVKQAYDAHIDAVTDYMSMNTKAVRPAKALFETDEPEFYRWYTYGGEERAEPLTREQLREHYTDANGFTQPFDNPAPSDADWAKFKNQKLGALREPIEALREIVAAHPVESAPWLVDTAREADWFRTPQKPNAEALASVIDALNFRAALLAAAGDEPNWSNLAATAHDSLRAAAPTVDLGPDSARTRALKDKWFFLEFNVGELEAATEADDSEHVEFYMHEIKNVLQDEPIFERLLNVPSTPLPLQIRLNREADDSGPAMEP
ncbi:hypothetical protein [Pseudomonas savastanoi]|uniref:hypothetical protein n=1 Tax=Pseudomonas savastanoi TaxID=29438 RepID=UPI00178476A2|nr:hypothetical protein [Pseudomonas savastanoi]QOI07953.1 hypothetical protein D5S10_29970 [Pseudomonas savastanoi]